jgi:hypothetical protein
MLERILQKLGIKSIDDLKPSEKATWVAWSKVLGRPDVSIEDLKKLLPIELERANVELRNAENSPKKDSYYKAYCSILAMLTKMIVAPTQEREQLKAMLNKKYGIE